ncbi:MAG: hypothetical protein VX392_03950 [Verrucomicrobiota bacterium]|nr:hypothetical protein [Verrucomicrobiota bacterium]
MGTDENLTGENSPRATGKARLFRLAKRKNRRQGEFGLSLDWPSGAPTETPPPESPPDGPPPPNEERLPLKSLKSLAEPPLVGVQPDEP